MYKIIGHNAFKIIQILILLKEYDQIRFLENQIIGQLYYFKINLLDKVKFGRKEKDKNIYLYIFYKSQGFQNATKHKCSLEKFKN